VKEAAGAGLENARDAIVGAVQTAVCTKSVLRLVVKDEARDEQVKAAIIIVVEPDGAR
jgi:hypothetical protein